MKIKLNNPLDVADEHGDHWGYLLLVSYVVFALTAIVGIATLVVVLLPDWVATIGLFSPIVLGPIYVILRFGIRRDSND